MSQTRLADDPTLSVEDDRCCKEHHHLMTMQPRPAPLVGLVTGAAS